MRERLRRLGGLIPEQPKVPVMPGASVEDLALALLSGRLRLEDVPADDSRRVEAATMLIAHAHCAQARRENPDDPMNTASLAYPRLRAAFDARNTQNPESADEQA